MSVAAPPRHSTRATHQSAQAAESRPWRGPTRPYDLVKEFTIATVLVTLLVVGLAVLLGSPDEKAVTLQGWAKAAPADFVLTTVTELDGSSHTAGYGPPYNHAAEGQKLGPLATARLGGYRLPVDAAADFVIAPLSQLPPSPALGTALTQWKRASTDQQQKWANAYDTAIGKAPDSDPAKVTAGNYGPVPQLGRAELALARSGGLDGSLGRSAGFYSSDYTAPLLFLDGWCLSPRGAASAS